MGKIFIMANNIPDETELMNRLAEGDMSALSDIANKHQDRVLALSYRFLNDWTVAEDIAQEVFLRVYKAAKTYKPEARFSTWLYRIVVNLCLDEKRKQAKAPISLEQANSTGFIDTQSDIIERKEIVQSVQTAVGELPERQRLVLILHRYEGLSYEKICEVTGWSRSAVESLLVRAYSNLRNKLKKIKNFVE
jgi:RNA polymerase sigma-70 factor (ECF subfamily)